MITQQEVIIMSKYRVIYAGQGAGYKIDDIIEVSGTTIDTIACKINLKSSNVYLDLALTNNDINRMEFCQSIDGVVFNSVVLIVEKLEAQQ